MNVRKLGGCTLATALSISPTSMAWADDGAAPETRGRSVVQELQDRIHEEKLRGEYERVLRENEEARRHPGDVVPPRGIENRKLLLSDLFAVSYAPIDGFSVFGASSGPLTISRYDGPHGISSSKISFAPSADVVIGRRWTLGAAISASRTTIGASNSEWNPDRYSIGAAPRVGLLVPLGEGVSLWPEFALGVARYREQLGLTAEKSLGWTVTPAVSTAIVFPLSRHIFARANASLSYALAYDEHAEDYTFLQFGSELGLGLAL